MAMQLAEMEWADPEVADEALGQASAPCDSDLTEDDAGAAVARGVVLAALIAAPFWALLAFTIYLLV